MFSVHPLRVLGIALFIFAKARQMFAIVRSAKASQMFAIVSRTI